MSSKTAFYRLGDLTDWFSGGTPSKKNPECWGDEIPWISASSMGGSRYSNSDLKITKLGLESGSRLALKGSILLLVRGSTLHNRIPVGIAVRDVAFNQDVKAIRVKPELAARQVTDEMYLYYWLKANEKKLLEMVEHTGIGAGKLDTKRLQDLEIRLPSWSEQRQIVASATAIDEKEILNSCINQTLEQMAQAIFKSWFVDFEPVKAKIAALEAGGSEEDALLAAMQAISGKGEEKLTRLQAEQPEQYAELRATAELFPSAMQDSELGEIPEGWSVGHLSELIQFNPRRSLKKGTLAPYLDMKNVPTSGHLAEDIVLREMNSGTKFINGDSLLARITPCLENGKTAYVDFLDSDQVGWGSTEYIVMRSQEPYPESLSYFIARNRNFRQHAIQSMTGTSGRQRANAKALAELPWIIYPQEIAVAFGRIATPYLRLARSHGNESKSLSAIRDSLLPKLLSGELEITRKDA
ncbi:type I restriction enzyme, S subunit [Halopseudomonas formosensis]|uniref:Type I restriction enzyme, S subunit n=1 Tax=Halopseudomonas formosensis TaxID=1002526 RepID=A0A1I6BRC1_9GAMM|nr:restriction endonuclease subunit S [Halopseudomonas formosensis]SFQ83414.1 type I restriction enzyme, S subunit [Halopseudomonas formosensis]